MTELDKARHTLEQKLLPAMFAEEKANMLNSILDKEGRFFTDCMIVYLGVRNEAYRSDDIKVYLQRAKSEDKFFDFVMAKLPETKTPGISDTVYFCLEETTGQTMYFTAEIAAPGQRLLCSTDGTERTEHGILPDDADKEFQKMANTFIRKLMETKE